MDACIDLSRAVAAGLAIEFSDDPGAELAAWLRIALEREGMVASLYERRSVETRLRSLPKRLARTAIALVNGICANEENHVTYIRSLLEAECAWPEVTLREGWGRLQGIVLNQLAGTSAVAQAIGLILLELGARSAHERAAARAVAKLDAGGFLEFSRTLEITAVESYQRVIALLTGLHHAADGVRSSFARRFKMLGVLRDERVHRDVFHVLFEAFGSKAVAAPRAHAFQATELPEDFAARPIASPADLNKVCRAILAFHYGVALPAGATPEQARRAAIDYWRWHLQDPRRRSYLVDCQRQSVFRPTGQTLLVGTAGLANVVQRTPRVRCDDFDRDLIAWFTAEREPGLPSVPKRALRGRAGRDGRRRVTPAPPRTRNAVATKTNEPRSRPQRRSSRPGAVARTRITPAVGAQLTSTPPAGDVR